MIRKVSLLMVIFMLVFSPAMTAFAATEDTTNEGTEQGATAEGEEEVAAPEEDGVENTESDSEAADQSIDEANDSVETDSNSEEQTTDNDADTNTEEADNNESVETDANVEEEEQAETEEVTGDDEEGEEEAEVQEEEELDLTNIHGAANGEIYYDITKGHYVLDLQAGLSNYSDQEIKQKWVAFALPEGVGVPADADVPAGVALVQLYDGHTGIAVKIPDVTAFPDSKYVYPKIPLTGSVDADYNSPNENLYLFNVDEANQVAEDLGQIKSQRNIDFSVMEDNPGLDMEGSLNGEVVFDSENHAYNLELTGTITNNTDQVLEDFYVGFELPDGVQAANADGIAGLQLDNGKRGLAIQFAEINEGENEVNVTIELIGKTDGEVSNKNLTLYMIDSSYREIGQINGQANIDYSAMNQEWEFNGEAQLVKDFPGLADNQFGLRFAFDVQNLTIDDVDKVKLEFNVPSDIKVHEPDEYQSGGDLPDSLKDFLDDDLSGSAGSLDIEWNGNTATVTLGDLKGSEWAKGYFTAIGESSKSLNQLKGMDVTITLYRDNDMSVQEINVPFKIVPYEGPGGDDGKDPGNGNDDGKKPGTGGDDNNAPGTGDDNNAPGTDNGSNNDGSNGDGTANNGSANDGSSNNDGANNDGPTVSGTDSDSNGDTLPKTGTFFGTWFWQLFGALLLVSGGFVYRRSRVVKA